MFFHGTNDRALSQILETGEIRPANPDIYEGVRHVLNDYVVPEKIDEDLVESVAAISNWSIAFTVQQQGTSSAANSVHFCDDISMMVGGDQAPGSCFIGKVFVENGGEFADGVRQNLEGITGYSIQPRHKGAKPVILEVDTDAERILGGFVHQGAIGVQKIKRVYLIDDMEISRSLTLDEARTYCRGLRFTRNELLSDLGGFSKRNNAFYNALIEAAPLDLRRTNAFGDNPFCFMSQIAKYANMYEPCGDYRDFISQLQHLKYVSGQAKTPRVSEELYDREVARLKAMPYQKRIKLDRDGNVVGARPEASDPTEPSASPRRPPSNPPLSAMLHQKRIKPDRDDDVVGPRLVASDPAVPNASPRRPPSNPPFPEP